MWELGFAVRLESEPSPTRTSLGYKVDIDTFVEVTKEELENVALESTRTIEIDEFVDRTETRAI